MKIGLYFEHGEIDEIGTGHKYRAEQIKKCLELREHEVGNVALHTWFYCDVLIIDHVFSHKILIEEAKNAGKKVVLIDGDPEDAKLADLSISVCYNNNAEYIGLEYLVFPTDEESREQGPNNDTKKVFVGLGGYDKNRYIDLILKCLPEYELVVARSINHSDLQDGCGVSFYEGEDYFKPMKECSMAITNGGLTMFQAMYMGLPCIPLCQYEHQQSNINMIKHIVYQGFPNEHCIKTLVKKMAEDNELRKNISEHSKETIDGKGVERICQMIENL